MQFVSNGLQHTMNTVMVFQSTEYSMFKMINGNRQLNESKIKRIIRDIESGIDVLMYYPIQVIEKGKRLEIHDGQHRFYISRKLKRPVHYIVMKEERPLSDIAKINSNTEKWNTRDFINCYMQQGNKHYEELQRFMDEYGFSASVAIKLLEAGTPGTESGYAGKDSFERGRFQVLFKEKAHEIAKACMRFNLFPHWRQRGFVIAIHRIMVAEKISLDELAEKCFKHPDMLKKQGSFKEYILNLESIANKGKQLRLVIS